MSAAPKTPKPPPGLGRAGAALWRQAHRALDAGWEFDERELATLALACRQRDDVAALEAELKRGKVVVKGSKGQPVLNGLVAELRLQRLAVSRLLGSLSLPDVEGKPETAASRRARRAAQIRWRGKVDRLDDRRAARGSS